jgi:hypothetical protein
MRVLLPDWICDTHVSRLNGAEEYLLVNPKFPSNGGFADSSKLRSATKSQIDFMAWYKRRSDIPCHNGRQRLRLSRVSPKSTTSPNKLCATD